MRFSLSVYYAGKTLCKVILRGIPTFMPKKKISAQSIAVSVLHPILRFSPDYGSGHVSHGRGLCLQKAEIEKSSPDSTVGMRLTDSM